MANFTINGHMKVKTLKELFKQEFEGTLRVYDGKNLADDETTLAAIRSNEGAKGGELTCRASRTVGKFEAEMWDVFGIKVQVASPDNWVLALDGITLSKLCKIKKQATKADMEELVAYRRKAKEDEEGDKKYSKAYYDHLAYLDDWLKRLEAEEDEEGNEDEEEDVDLDEVYDREKLYIGYEEEEFEDMLFDGKIDFIHRYNDESKIYRDSDRAIYSADKKVLIEISKNINNYEVLDGTEIIAESACMGSQYLWGIDIPSSVKKIKDYAFSRCCELNSVYIPEGVETIGDWAFDRCGICELHLPQSLKSIAKHAFSDNSIDSIEVPVGSLEYFQTQFKNSEWIDYLVEEEEDDELYDDGDEV